MDLSFHQSVKKNMKNKISFLRETLTAVINLILRDSLLCFLLLPLSRSWS